MPSSITVILGDDPEPAPAPVRSSLKPSRISDDMLWGTCAFCERAFALSDPRTMVLRDRVPLGECHPGCARSYLESVKP